MGPEAAGVWRIHGMVRFIYLKGGISFESQISILDWKLSARIGIAGAIRFVRG
jgi:hypothetical protein